MKKILLVSLLVILTGQQIFAQCGTTISGVLCGTSCNATVVFTPSAGTPPYNLVVTGGPTTLFTSSYTWTSVCAGSYHYDITDAAATCHDTGTVVVSAAGPTIAPALNIYAQDYLGNIIADNASPSATVCELQTIDFFVSVGFINAMPNTFTWKKNGVPVLVQNNVANYFAVTWQTSTLASGDVITLEVTWPSLTTSPVLCLNPTTRVSQALNFTVTPNQPPAVTITDNLPPGDTICQGNTATFTANPVDAGTPTYQWYLDGSPVGTALNYTTLSSLAAGNHQMMCCITSSESCDSQDPVYNPTVCDTVNFYVMICTSVQEQFAKEAISIYPNPATNQFTIYGLRFTIENVEIYNPFGEKILSQKPTTKSQQQITIDISNLPSGIYFVKVKSDKAERTAKFLKQ